MSVTIKDSFQEAVSDDLSNQYFLSAIAAKAQTDIVTQHFNIAMAERTEKYINTTLETLIIEAINKGISFITVTFPNDINKDGAIDILNKAGYSLTPHSNGALKITWN